MSARGELGTLEASGLIALAQIEPELEYLFRHALVQDAAYSSLLKQDRRVLHRRAAETLLALYPDRRRELAAVIAMHYEQAGDAPNAAAYLVEAGEHALERFANREAISFFERAVALIGTDGVSPDLRLRAAIGMAKVGWSITATDKYIDGLDRAIASADDNTERRLLADAYFWVAFLRRWRGEQPATSEALRAALANAERIGESLGDPVAHAIPKAFMGIGRVFSGDVRGGAADLSEALRVMEGKADRLSIAILMGYLTMAYARLGDFASAERTLANTERIASEGDEISKLDASIARAAIELERGNFDAALPGMAACAIRSEELGATACAVASNVLLGSGHLTIDDVTGARAPVYRGLELSLVTNMPPMRTLATAMRGSIRARLGELMSAATDWDEALASARAMGDRYGEAMTLWGRGRTHFYGSSPDPALALKDLDASIALVQQMETRPALARLLRDRAAVLRALGRDAEAAEADRRSREIASEIGLRDFAPETV